jgi:hypothetical protein
MIALAIATQNALRHFADRPNMRPSEWCQQNLRFDEPGNHAPFSLAGAEYCVEPLDDFADTSLTDIVDVWGSQTRKTGTTMGGAAWRAVNAPCNCLWVMPSINLAQSFSRKRWLPMLRASGATRELLPTGAQRHDVKTLEQRIGAAAVKFVGSNSAANLASEPCQLVIQDETDKFDMGGREEADASNLADQRTKGQVNPQRRKGSTPTLTEGLIWQEAIKGDMRRRFQPCWHCGRQNSSRRVVFAWSAEYTVLKKTGSEAYVIWDKEARRTDGSWDLDRVERSARFRCPHCGGDILDAHKTWMNREGVWQPTQRAHSGFRSRHLPSLYACSPETTVGKLAVKFLQAKNSLLGLRGFINGDLAEPYESQDRASQRVEIVTEKTEITEPTKILTADYHANRPYLHYVARAWGANNDSECFDAGELDTWEELRAKQLEHGILDECVVIDSGYNASDVYAACARFGQFMPRRDKLPLHMGWLPAKGMPGRKKWPDPDTRLEVPWYLRASDPFLGTSQAGQVEMSLLEFSGDFFKDILDAMRQGKGGVKWRVLSKAATEEYWRHLDSEHRMRERNPKTGFYRDVWLPISRHRPNHKKDCEVMQVVAAAFYNKFKLPEN